MKKMMTLVMSAALAIFASASLFADTAATFTVTIANKDELAALGCKVTGDGEYKVGKKVTLKATAPKGAVFTGWTVDGPIWKDGDGFDTEFIPATETDVGQYFAEDYRSTTLTIAKVPEGFAGESFEVYANFDTAARDWLTGETDEDGWPIFGSADPSCINLYNDKVDKAQKKTVANIRTFHNSQIPAGVFVCSQLRIESGSLPTVSVTGLPSGLKFTAKQVTDKTYGVIPANSIYGTATTPGLYNIAISVKNASGFTTSLSYPILVGNFLTGAYVRESGAKTKAVLGEGVSASYMREISVNDSFTIPLAFGLSEIKGLDSDAKITKVAAKKLPSGVKFTADKSDVTGGVLVGTIAKAGVYPATFTVTVAGYYDPKTGKDVKSKTLDCSCLFIAYNKIGRDIAQIIEEGFENFTDDLGTAPAIEEAVRLVFDKNMPVLADLIVSKAVSPTIAAMIATYDGIGVNLRGSSAVTRSLLSTRWAYDCYNIPSFHVGYPAAAELDAYPYYYKEWLKDYNDFKLSRAAAKTELVVKDELKAGTVVGAMPIKETLAKIGLLAATVYSDYVLDHEFKGGEVFRFTADQVKAKASVKASGLPAGLSLKSAKDKATGDTVYTLSGAATKPGIYSATLTVSFNGKSATFPMGFEIKAGASGYLDIDVESCAGSTGYALGTVTGGDVVYTPTSKIKLTAKTTQAVKKAVFGGWVFWGDESDDYTTPYFPDRYTYYSDAATITLDAFTAKEFFENEVHAEFYEIEPVLRGGMSFRFNETSWNPMVREEVEDPLTGVPSLEFAPFYFWVGSSFAPTVTAKGLPAGLSLVACDWSEMKTEDVIGPFGELRPYNGYYLAEMGVGAGGTLYKIYISDFSQLKAGDYTVELTAKPANFTSDAVVATGEITITINEGDFANPSSYIYSWPTRINLIANHNYTAADYDFALDLDALARLVENAGQMLCTDPNVIVTSTELPKGIKLEKKACNGFTAWYLVGKTTDMFDGMPTFKVKFGPIEWSEQVPLTVHAPYVFVGAVDAELSGTTGAIGTYETYMDGCDVDEDDKDGSVKIDGLGTVTGGGRFLPGAKVTIKATPAAGYTFVRWSGTAVDAVLRNPESLNDIVDGLIGRLTGAQYAGGSVVGAWLEKFTKTLAADLRNPTFTFTLPDDITFNAIISELLSSELYDFLNVGAVFVPSYQATAADALTKIVITADNGKSGLEDVSMPAATSHAYEYEYEWDGEKYVPVGVYPVGLASLYDLAPESLDIADLAKMTDKAVATENGDTLSCSVGTALKLNVIESSVTLPTVKVTGLPSGLKFTDKEVTDKTFGTIKAGTIYGVPTKAGVAKVKVTVTTSSKAESSLDFNLNVVAMPKWAVGTFNGVISAGFDDVLKGWANVIVDAAKTAISEFPVGRYMQLMGITTYGSAMDAYSTSMAEFALETGDELAAKTALQDAAVTKAIYMSEEDLKAEIKGIELAGKTTVLKKAKARVYVIAAASAAALTAFGSTGTYSITVKNNGSISGTVSINGKTAKVSATSFDSAKLVSKRHIPGKYHSAVALDIVDPGGYNSTSAAYAMATNDLAQLDAAYAAGLTPMSPAEYANKRYEIVKFIQEMKNELDSYPRYYWWAEDDYEDVEPYVDGYTVMTKFTLDGTTYAMPISLCELNKFERKVLCSATLDTGAYTVESLILDRDWKGSIGGMSLAALALLPQVSQTAVTSLDWDYYADGKNRRYENYAFTYTNDIVEVEAGVPAGAGNWAADSAVGSMHIAPIDVNNVTEIAADVRKIIAIVDDFKDEGESAERWICTAVDAVEVLKDLWKYEVKFDALTDVKGLAIGVGVQNVIDAKTGYNLKANVADVKKAFQKYFTLGNELIAQMIIEKFNQTFITIPSIGDRADAADRISDIQVKFGNLTDKGVLTFTISFNYNGKAFKFDFSGNLAPVLVLADGDILTDTIAKYGEEGLEELVEILAEDSDYSGFSKAQKDAALKRLDGLLKFRGTVFVAEMATKLPAAIEYDGVEVFPKGKTFVLPLPVTIPDNGKVEDVFANLYELVRDPVIRRMISNIKLFR